MTKNYGQFCPVAKASEILAERWTPLVLRELMCGSTTFNEIQRGVPLMSRSLLSKRLKELERAGVVERRPQERGHTYHLTQAGEELRSIVMQLGEWGQRWARSEVTPTDLDPRLVMWDMHRSVDVDRLPTGRVVAQFEFSDAPVNALRRAWLLLERPDVDVCYKDPGYEIDLLVSTSLRTLIMVWMGDIGWGDALREHDLRIEGRRDLAHAFPGWLKLSGFAGVQRPPVASKP